MTAPTNQPVVSSIPYFGPSFILGQTTNDYQPLKVGSWNVVIPSVLIGNEAKVGYAAFTLDNVTVNCGDATGNQGIPNLVGVFLNYFYQEGDVGSLTYNATFGNNFQVPVLGTGSVYAYNSGPISATVADGIHIVKSVSSTAYNSLLGSFYQSANTPTGVSTGLDVSAYFRVRSAQATAGAGFLLEIPSFG